MRSCQGKVVYGITTGTSADALLRGQLAWLTRQGWDVTLVTSPDAAAEKAAAREGVKLAILPMSREVNPLADVKSLWAWLSLISKHQPAVVNVSTPKAGLLGGLAAWVLGVPRRLYVVRGLRLEGCHGLLAAVLWLMELISMRVATDVIFVSESLAREAQRRHLIRAGHAWLVGCGSSNGVDVKAIARRLAEVDAERMRAALGIEPGDFVIGYVGRVVQDKGVDTLLRAFTSAALSPRVRLLLIGRIEDESLRLAIAELGCRARWVEWTDDVAGHLSAIDTLVLPTRREGFPNVVLEAAAAGIPAIVTRATGAIDSVIHGETGLLFDVGDADGLVEKINGLSDDALLTRQLGAAARKRAIRHFSPKTIWQGLSAIMGGHEHAAAATRRV